MIVRLATAIASAVVQRRCNEIRHIATFQPSSRRHPLVFWRARA